MAHYALLNENNEVVQVISGVDENIIQIDTDESQVGGSTEAWESFYESRPWFQGLKCKRTSYTAFGGKKINLETNEITNELGFRKNYASIGYIYDENRDAFIPPKPHNSWILNEETCLWESPTPMPQDGKQYMWVEDDLNWQVIE